MSKKFKDFIGKIRRKKGKHPENWHIVRDGVITSTMINEASLQTLNNIFESPHNLEDTCPPSAKSHQPLQNNDVKDVISQVPEHNVPNKLDSVPIVEPSPNLISSIASNRDIMPSNNLLDKTVPAYPVQK